MITGQVNYTEEIPKSLAKLTKQFSIGNDLVENTCYENSYKLYPL